MATYTLTIQTTRTVDVDADTADDARATQEGLRPGERVIAVADQHGAILTRLFDVGGLSNGRDLTITAIRHDGQIIGGDSSVAADDDAFTSGEATCYGTSVWATDAEEAAAAASDELNSENGA